MAEEMRERFALDRDLERRAPGEIRLHRLASTMLLSEEPFLRRTFLRPPLLHVSLQRAELARVVALRLAKKQLLEHRLRLQLGRVLEHGHDRRPVGLEWIRSRAPSSRP